MVHLHIRFTLKQVKQLFDSYLDKEIQREYAEKLFKD